MYLLQLRADDLKIKLSCSRPHGALGEFIETLADRDGKVVFLIDECEHLIFDAVGNPELHDSIRKLFRDLCYQIKGLGKYIHIVYITGISKHTKMGVLSAANNIRNFSSRKGYCTMLGFTHEEILDNFKYYIQKTAIQLGMSEDALLEKVKFYYDPHDFCKDGSPAVYSPISINRFFINNKFNNYKAETGDTDL